MHIDKDWSYLPRRSLDFFEKQNHIITVGANSQQKHQPIHDSDGTNVIVEGFFFPMVHKLQGR